MEVLGLLPDNSTAVRILGMIAIASGCWFACSGVYTPLSQGLSNQQAIYVTDGAVGISVVAVGCGLIKLIAGRHARKILLNRIRFATPLNVIVTFLIVAAAEILCEHFFELFLSRLGYSFEILP